MLIDFFQFTIKRLNKKTVTLFLITALTAIAANAIAVIFPLIQKKIIDGISLSFIDKKDIILLLFIAFAGSFISIITAVILKNLFMSFKNTIEMELLKSVTRKQSKIINAKGSGAFMVSIFGDSEQIASLIEINYFSVFILCISNIIILVISCKWSYIFIGTVVPAYILMLLTLFISNKIYTVKFAKARELVFSLNPKVLEFIENRDTVMSYSNIIDYEKLLGKDFLLRDKYFKQAFTVNALSKSILDIIKTMSMAAFFVLAMKEILLGNIRISNFFALLAYFSQIYLPINALYEISTGMNRFKMLKQRIGDSLEKSVKMELPSDLTLNIDSLYFSFKKDDKEIEILQNITIPIDKKIAVVGLSGEGKTTLIKLLLGKLCANSGQCTLGGANTYLIPENILRAGIRYYMQEHEIFNSDIHFNITLGKDGLTQIEYNKKQIALENELKMMFDKINNMESNFSYSKFTESEKEILKKLFLIDKKEAKQVPLKNIFQKGKLCNMDYVANMIASSLTSKNYYVKDKYNEIYKALDLEKLEGREFGQRGNKISGGEKAKVSLARFLLPEYEQFFILDEPFANLDLLSEKNCLSILKKYLTNYRGGIIISHKLNIIKELSEKIIILEDGKISKTGSQADLLKDNNLFKILNDINIENLK
ncbi:ATP-binding cassette domain-containing protein [Treponema pedis]|uniref:ATP-binding cassette domain-containing protein n=1 Tax=Treponema pedis TaxID=409322 RepID=UPI00040F3BF1|nr:ABC transporter ATP-binding protein [Treponema pedis]